MTMSTTTTSTISTTSTTSRHKHHKHHKQQQALDSLYAIGNVLTIKVTMPQTDWDAVRTEQPAGGVCNFQWAGGRQPIHVAKGNFGRDIWNKLSRADDVHSGGR
jgi:hypothetical protein